MPRPSLLDASRYRTIFARNTRKVVVYITTGLALGFTALQVRDVTVVPVITGTASEVIWRGALIAYFWCWRFGCIRDTDIQELAYVSMPNKGQWPFRSYGIVGLLIAVAVVLVATQGSVFWFSIALTSFFILDHLGWRHLVAVLADEGEKSGTAFREKREYFALEKLRLVRQQIQGNWKWWRLGAGAMIVVIIDAFAFVPAFRSLVTAQVVAQKIGLPPGEAETFVYSVLVLSFVVVMEVWHYWIRLKTWISLDCLDELGESYILRRKPGTALHEV
ncbi:hypothetical protein [Bradyrhizobium stylosanthis]|uniref:Uncharacterized protein n=1 Tax=Bradyrhizobium stylosanthis TaxID=1803665 RepID=A0A560E594_9BRAD|nr:hypothetical protein [Bradyrhizobium stylosanthis]TWB04527.1 hypothetical protein FBZ96_1021004 [Bradyrhizobium stylosanthis]